MNIAQKAIHGLLAVLSVILSFGVLAHDAHTDQIYNTATIVSTGGTYSEQQVSPQPIEEMRVQHAHSDYNPMSNALTNSFSYQSPSLAPRRDSHHKQLLRTLEEGGRHAFDNANLPIVA
jgi:hypothetical protein